jgi:hypothetical protein
MAVFEIDPTTDPRWTAFIGSHPRSSVFHTVPWLEALKQTYRYRPTVLTTTPNSAALGNGIALCRVDSWLTGSKWVSLPFSDHCEPLLEARSDFGVLLAAIRDRTIGRLSFAELRPRSAEWGIPSGWFSQSRYCLHVLDLRPGLDELYSNLHKDSIQRKIRRAERERVVVEAGRSPLLLHQFYDLMVLTRRRHGLPPQPLRWFRNLASCFGTQLTIRLARIDDRPIASLLTLRNNRTMVYKYGCSDERYHNAGGMPRLFWHAIEDAKSAGLQELDLGRSDEDQEGLIRFKDHLGAAKTTLQYWQFSTKPLQAASGLTRALKSPLVKGVIAHLPTPLFRLAGEMLYRHAG